jgi:hypothetical protein
MIKRNGADGKYQLEYDQEGTNLEIFIAKETVNFAAQCRISQNTPDMQSSTNSIALNFTELLDTFISLIQLYVKIMLSLFDFFSCYYNSSTCIAV